MREREWSLETVREVAHVYVGNGTDSIPYVQRVDNHPYIRSGTW